MCFQEVSLLADGSPTDFFVGFTSAPQFHELRSIVERSFTVLDAYVGMDGLPTFAVAAEPTKERFRNLIGELSKTGLMATLRHEGESILVRVFSKPTPKPQRYEVNFLLAAVTAATILYAGYWHVSLSPASTILTLIMPEANVFFQSALFAASLFAIIAVHEFSHKAACKMHGLDSTMPYFIPGPPPFGTFGALISLRSPPLNRDQLFDLGFSGPIAGFTATVAVVFLSFHMGVVVPNLQIESWQKMGLPLQPITWPSTPLLILLASDLVRMLGLKAIPAGSTVVLTQIEFAAWVGALLTFLNLLPIWQLDGGHISRAIFDVRGHRIATFVGLMVLVVSGYWFFALFILIWMFMAKRGFHGVEPLDSVSPLSRGRKGIYSLSIVMLILCFIAIV